MLLINLVANSIILPITILAIIRLRQERRLQEAFLKDTVKELRSRRLRGRAGIARRKG